MGEVVLVGPAVSLEIIFGNRFKKL